MRNLQHRNRWIGIGLIFLILGGLFGGSVRAGTGKFDNTTLPRVEINGDGTHTPHVYGEGSAALYAGTLSATTTAVALSTTTAVSEVVVQSDPANSTNVLVGNATSQPMVLVPGSTMTLSAANLALIYVKSASGSDTVNWIGRS